MIAVQRLLIDRHRIFGYFPDPLHHVLDGLHDHGVGVFREEVQHQEYDECHVGDPAQRKVYIRPELTHMRLPCWRIPARLSPPRPGRCSAAASALATTSLSATR